MMGEEDEEHEDPKNPTTAAPPPTASAATTTTTTTKKPRGRPRGSKNKPKAPALAENSTTTPSDDVISGGAMRPMILEICAGADVVDAVAAFTRRRRVGICVLGGSGAVSNLTLRHPQGSAAVTIPGRFHILSLSGSLLLLSTHLSDDNTNGDENGNGGGGGGLTGGLSISVAGGQGQVIGGVVAGALTAASKVVVVATAVVSPSFHRLGGGGEGEEDVKPKIVNGVSCRGNDDSSSGVVAKCEVPNNPSSHLQHHQIHHQCNVASSVVPWAPRMK